jgi:hypothetical protein
MDLDPDPGGPKTYGLNFHFDANPDPTYSYYCDADPDPAPHQSDSKLRPIVTDTLRLHFEPPRLRCELPRLSVALF